MTTQTLPQTKLTLTGAGRPRTLLVRFAAALLHRDLQGALNVLAAAGERRALPHRLLSRKQR